MGAEVSSLPAELQSGSALCVLNTLSITVTTTTCQRAVQENQLGLKKLLYSWPSATPKLQDMP